MAANSPTQSTNSDQANDYQSSRHRAVPALFWLVAYFALFSCFEVMAAAQLMVTPTRIVFDGKSRSTKISVINSGDETGTYRISFVNKRMTLDGNFEDIKESNADDKFADKLVRFSPRQVVLNPGQSQVVRLSLRKPSKLADGEYRSHLLFKAIPKSVGGGIKEAVKKDKISIKLTPIVSITIPVIVRHGKMSAEVNFSSVKFNAANEKNPKPSLLMELERSGNQSIYGDMLAEFVENGGASNIIAQINGVAIYTPNKTRVITLPLNIPPGVNIKNGIINVFYRSSQDKGGKVLSQTQLKVP